MTQQTYQSLTDEAIDTAKKLIGVELRRYPRWTEANKELIIRFALAIGSRNPLYISDELMATNLFGTMVAHPTMLYSFDDTLIAPGLPGIHALHAGTDWQFYRPALLHDRITPTAHLLSVEQKHGEFCGPMALQIGEVIYKNQRGEEVARATSYVMRTPRDAARERGKYMDIARYRYSPEDLEGIDRAYEEEEIRGDVPRYWEDVQVGDDVPSIVKGPLSSDDMLGFIDAASGTITFCYFVDYMRRHPQAVYWDPDIGMPDSWDASMTKDAVAQAFGFPYSHDAGIQRICWLENMATNWTGNLGFLDALKVRLVRPNFIYDTTWCKGRVSGKHVTDGRYVVDLDVRCENQRGETTATGTATAALPSHDVDVHPPVIKFPARHTIS